MKHKSKIITGTFFLGFGLGGLVAMWNQPISVLWNPPTVTAVPVVAKNATADYPVGAVAVYKAGTISWVTPTVQLTREERAMLYALGQVESGGDYKAINTFVSRFGKYQISAEIYSDWAARQSGKWSDIMSRFFINENREFLFPEEWQDTAALWHFRNLMTEHPEIRHSAYDLAALWLGRADADYQQRVANLYAQYLEQKLRCSKVL